MGGCAGRPGQSYCSTDRSDAVFERLPVTLSLAGIALVLAVVMGILLGMLAAVRHNTLVDQGPCRSRCSACRSRISGSACC
jgi:peptide/nickel transport system permease protein